MDQLYVIFAVELSYFWNIRSNSLKLTIDRWPFSILIESEAVNTLFITIQQTTNIFIL